MQPCWRWCERRCCRRSRRKDRSAPGSSTTPAFPKKGRHSVGVARQYCGQLGKQDNCQIAVSLSVANDDASLPIAYRLYCYRKAWANDPTGGPRRACRRMLPSAPSPEIALDEIEAALAAGVPRGVVLADAGYGIDTAFRIAVTAMGLTYVVGIQSSTSLWPPGSRCRPGLSGILCARP